MAYSPSVFTSWKYTSDKGVEYSYKILQHIILETTVVGGVKVGGEAADGTEQRPPASFKPRVVLLWNVANKLARRVVAFTATAPLYCGTEGGNPVPEADMDLSLYAGRPSELLVFKCYGYEGERGREDRPKV